MTNTGRRYTAAIRRIAPQVDRLRSLAFQYAARGCTPAQARRLRERCGRLRVELGGI